ncbi:hypothetical protein [Catenuloplanes atrovinosus]|uniref:CopG family transcriptional regulator n=1 Tax=Catenuloplanes atrovinosus TaxID=137266 RepID=A0AAE4CD74_9ACTN|nr:hypothetical protein [Catenuloplanes atrovinosus]MDR7278759.1 hypothetical protein [Catenuloplanes atrovinosus]
MTKKLTVSLPDDVAARLSREANVSAYVATAIRRQMDRERTVELLGQAGYELTVGHAEAGFERLHEAQRQMSTDLRRQADELIAGARRGELP